MTPSRPPPRRSRRFFLRPAICSALLLASLGASSAQNVLYAEHAGKMHLVHRVRDQSPIVEENGREVLARGQKFHLRPVDEFLPVLIGVNGLSVGSRQQTLGLGTLQFGNGFMLRGEFQSAHTLENVFLVLEIKIPDAAQTLFVQEIGRLESYQPKSLKVTLRGHSDIGVTRYHVHLFAGGREVFNSEQSDVDREAILDRMVATRLKQVVADADPQRLFSPPAEYPPQLANTKLQGQATIRCRIDPRGVVLEPVAIATSHPEFGEAAVAALIQWRFVPRVKNGQPVESTVNLPVVFNPPEK